MFVRRDTRRPSHPCAFLLKNLPKILEVFCRSEIIDFNRLRVGTVTEQELDSAGTLGRHRRDGRNSQDTVWNTDTATTRHCNGTDSIRVSRRVHVDFGTRQQATNVIDATLATSQKQRTRQTAVFRGPRLDDCKQMASTSPFQQIVLIQVARRKPSCGVSE